MLYFAVIDTNVLVSALLKEFSSPWKVVQFVRIGKIIPLFSKEILKEYDEVLHRKEKYDFPEEDIQDVLLLMKNTGMEFNGSQVDEIFKDGDDVKFYSVVLTAINYISPYSKLVTGNKKDFPVKEFIVSADEMVDIVEKDIH